MAWSRIVDYDSAVRMCSINGGDGSRAVLDRLTTAECDGRAAGAWMANDEDSYVVYRSAAAHKRAAAGKGGTP